MSCCWGRIDWKPVSKDSPFDKDMIEGCAKVLKSGKVFRNNPLVVRRRRLEGVMGIVAQHAEELFEKSREQGPMFHQVMEKPDPEAFNFTKADEKEKMADIKLNPPGRSDAVNVTVFASTSPVCKHHVVFVPRCDELLPAHMTEETLLYGLCILAKSTRLDFRLLFDSPGSCVTTNHFHYQGLYLNTTGLKDGRFPLETVERTVIAGDFTEGKVAIELMHETSWYVRGFVIVGGGKAGDTAPFPQADIQTMVVVAAHLIQLLQGMNIPHTVIMAPANSPRLPKNVSIEAAMSGSAEDLHCPMSPEIFILPRRHIFETTGPAGCELGGLILSRTEQDYTNLTEPSVRGFYMQTVSCEGQVFAEVCMSYPATCMDLRQWECLASPSDMRIPYTHRANQFLSEWRTLDLPRESASGSRVLIARSQLIREGQQLVLWSGCNASCEDCLHGTGNVLMLNELNMCIPSHEGGVFALRYNNGKHHDTYQQCWESLAAYDQDLERQTRVHTIIKYTAFGTVASVGCTIGALILCYKCHCKPRQEELQRANLDASGRARPPQMRLIDKADIDQIFPVVYSHSDSTCCVCLVNIGPDEPCRRLQCNHEFHAECISSWWTHIPRASLECPLCKRRQAIDDEQMQAVGTPSTADPTVDAREAAVVLDLARPSASPRAFRAVPRGDGGPGAEEGAAFPSDDEAEARPAAGGPPAAVLGRALDADGAAEAA